MMTPTSTYRQDASPFHIKRKAYMTQRTLTLGKRRGLSQCAASNGTFTIVALDHRQAIKSVFAGRPDPYAAAVDFKRDVVSRFPPPSCWIRPSAPGRCWPTAACRALAG
jgi:hypothetical protein